MGRKKGKKAVGRSVKNQVRKSAPEKSVLDLANEHMLARGDKPEAKGVFGTGNFRKKVVSDSLAVHPEQIPEAIETAKRLGVPVEFQPNGQPVFDNSSHFRRYAKAHGWVHYGY